MNIAQRRYARKLAAIWTVVAAWVAVGVAIGMFARTRSDFSSWQAAALWWAISPPAGFGLRIVAAVVLETVDTVRARFRELGERDDRPDLREHDG